MSIIKIPNYLQELYLQQMKHKAYFNKYTQYYVYLILKMTGDK